MGDFVTPERVRLPLSGGAFIDIKKRLNHGETEDMYAMWAPTTSADGTVQVTRNQVRTSKVLFYLLGWSLTSDDGTPAPYAVDMPEADRLATIRSLDPERFSEIHKAIEAHEAAMDTARAAQKKTAAGSPPAAVISPSLSGVAGVSSGYANSTQTIMRSSSNT